MAKYKIYEVLPRTGKTDEKHGLLDEPSAVTLSLWRIFVCQEVKRALIGVLIKPLLVNVNHVHHVVETARRGVDKLQTEADALLLMRGSQNWLDLARVTPDRTLLE